MPNPICTVAQEVVAKKIAARCADDNWARYLDIATEVLHQARSNFVERGVSMLLWCPECGTRHIDAGDRPPHKTHACQECGLLWRPALIETHGARFLPGCKDETD